MRPIGLHVRINDTIHEAIEYAHHLDIPIFQCFLVNQINRQPLNLDTATIAQAKGYIGNQRRLYVHGSYWVNLVQLTSKGITMLKNEIKQAKELGSDHIILHPGATPEHLNHTQGIDVLADILNKIMEYEQDIILVLENTAHAHPAIGSNLEDFQLLKEKLIWPERLRFCIDTAHAHAYGYNLTDTIQQETFINLIDQMIGIGMVELLHLNDATYPCGSRIDKHAVLGTGTIGIQALKSFALHPRLATIPLILELPSLPHQEDNAMLQLVRSWHN